MVKIRRPNGKQTINKEYTHLPCTTKQTFIQGIIMSEKNVTIRESYIPVPSEFQILQVLAKNASASGLYNGVGSEQKILMVLLAARELGIPPMQALNGGLWNIQGKIEISARLMTSMIRRCGHSINVKMISDKECILEGTRTDNGDSFSASFTIEEAQRAGLVRPGSNWIKYPQDMLYARAISRLARRLFPDVIGTAYVEGEIRDVNKEDMKEENLMTVEIEEKSDQDKSEEFYAIFLEKGHNLDRLEEYIQKLEKVYNKNKTAVIDKALKNIEGFETNFKNWIAKEEEKK
jgi:hypothetical protein